MCTLCVLLSFACYTSFAYIEDVYKVKFACEIDGYHFFVAIFIDMIGRSQHFK